MMRGNDGANARDVVAVADHLFRVSMDLLCTADLEGRFVRLNALWERVLGYVPGQLVGQPLLDLLHPDDREETARQIRELSAGGRLLSMENRLRHRDGGYRRILWNALASPSERIIYAAGRDVSDLRRDEDRLRVLSRVLEQSPVSVMITDRRGNIEYINPRFTEISGFTPEEMEGKNPRVMKSGKQSPEIYRELWETISQGRTWRGPLQNLKKNGELFWEHETIAPVRDPDGTITHYVAIKEDITEGRSAQEMIRSQSALLDVATDAIQIRDLENRVLYWNKGAEKIYGWSSEEVRGRKVNEVLASDPDQFRPAMQALMADGQWHGELTQKTKDGRAVIMECRWSLVPESEDHQATILAINTDITERKKLEAQFLRAQRMESIGTLAGGIAHDLNNILGPILLSIDYLREKNTDESSQRVLNALETSANRGADLIRQVLMFARGVQGEHIVLQPSHLIKEVAKILAETFPRMIRITSNLPSDLWTVSGDPTQLHQVLMNLCVNARDAISDGGEIHISAENVTLDEHYVRTNLEAQVGPYVVMTVSDTGMGIAPRVLPRIFEPFFTTKEEGKGTGLGLSTVRAIVKSHGGFINVYSEPGRGSTFKVYLPASAALRERVTKPAISGSRHGHGELILVVDDEDPILEVTRTALEASGYRVITAQDGTEALAVYSQSKNEIAVVITDMMMPYLDGAATIRALHKLNPRVKIIAASGLEVNGKEKNVAGLVNAFLPKPYTRERLLSALSEVLPPAMR